jgi:hypothetical protein
MMESEWLVSEDPRPMLDHLHGSGSPRKLRLFACGCCRLWGRLLDQSSRRAVEVAERHADGEATEQELREAGLPGRTGFVSVNIDFEDRWRFAMNCAEDELVPSLKEMLTSAWAEKYRAAQAALLRDVAGNPWRRVTLPEGPRTKCSCRMYGRDGWIIDFRGNWQKHDRCDRDGWIISPSPWLTPTVVSLARAAYETPGEVRCYGCNPGPADAPARYISTQGCTVCGNRGFIAGGLLAPDRLAVLADALSDASCDSEELLRHLRGQERCRTCEGGGVICDAGGGGYVGTMSPKKAETHLRYSDDRPCNFCSGGWVTLPGPHARGCWALDLILGKE